MQGQATSGYIQDAAQCARTAEIPEQVGIMGGHCKQLDDCLSHLEGKLSSVLRVPVPIPAGPPSTIGLADRSPQTPHGEQLSETNRRLQGFTNRLNDLLTRLEL